MRLAGLSREDSMNRTAQQQVRRMAEKLKDEKKKPPINSAQALQSATTLNRPPLATVSVAGVKRKITKMATKMRLNSMQAHASRKESAETKAHYTQSFKKATLLCAEEEKKPKKQRKSAETIVLEINEKENVILCSRTVRNYVKKGKVGETPEKRGEKGSIIPQAYKALCGALESYVKLAAQEGKQQMNRPSLIKRVNAVVNKHPLENRRGRKLFERIQSDLASTLNIGEPDRIEQRRAKWTTFSNVNVWFDSLREFFIHYGFATAREVPDEENGELIFGAYQENRIVSLDESAIILDNTACNKGGRPAMSFYDPKIQDAPQAAAHKNSYRATGMYGCTMGGQPIAPHFVLPTEAMLENQQINKAFILQMKRIAFDMLFRPDFLSPEERVTFFPATIGMNEKGSMNKEELDNYFMNNFIKLWPDKADAPGKRVCALIDGGPGRTNAEMLTKLRMLGILLFPAGPPNTTQLLQIMDQLFGLLKSIFIANFDALWEHRLCLPASHALHERVGRNDIGILLFGGEIPDGPILKDAFNHALSTARITSEWKKAGIKPFTRAALKSKKIRHELIQTDNGDVDTDADPKAAYLKTLQELNTTSCQILDAFGYDGEQLRIELPVRNNEYRLAQLTEPDTRARQDAISNSKSQGDLFMKTHGSTLNCDDFFISEERGKRKDLVKTVDTEKEERLKQFERQKKALEIIGSQKADKDFNSTDLKNLIAWKTGKSCPSKVSNVAQRRALWDSMKNDPAPADATWTEAEEERLKRLQQEIDTIPIENTRLGRQKEEMKELLFASLQTMSAEEKERARAILEDEDGDETQFGAV
jgi:hypothetical protein